MYIKVNDVDLGYDVAGTGRPIIFIHGYPLCRKLWQPQIHELSSYASVYTIDLRGHGESSDVSSPFSMDTFAEDINAFLDANRIFHPVILCGLSMGGYIAFAFYRKFQWRIAGLIFTATKATSDSVETQKNRDRAILSVQADGPGVIFDSMVQKLLSPKTYSTNPSLVHQTMELMRGSVDSETIIKDLSALKDRLDSTSLLDKISVPTLIIHGADDQIVHFTEAQGMQGIISNAELVIINRAGHLPNIEQPKLFNKSIIDFIHTF